MLKFSIVLKKKLNKIFNSWILSWLYHWISCLVKFIYNIIPMLINYFQMPACSEKWLRISQRFNEQWNYHYCIGAMDGTTSTNDQWQWLFNNKTRFSIVFFALVVADYYFLYADFNCEGRVSDGGVFRNAFLFQCLQNGV